jgi:branched-chain amino acid transport system permease protein
MRKQPHPGPLAVNGKKFVPPVAIFVVAAFLPAVISNNYYIHLLNTSMIYLIAVYGLNFISGMAGQTNLGTAGVFGLGAYTSALFTTKLGLSPWLALAPAVAMGLLIGIVLGYPSLRVKGLFLTLTTIAFTEITRLVENNWAFVGGALGVKGVPNYVLFNVEIKSRVQFYYLMLVYIAFFSIVTYRIVHSKWGRAFVAIRDNQDAVASCGISLAQAKITAFTLSTVYGSVAGAIYAQCFNYVNASSFTTDLSILFVVMLMFGGLGSMYGNIIGCLVITVLPEILRFLGDYYQLVYAFIVMAFAIFLPGGLVSVYKGYREKKLHRDVAPRQ